MGTPLVLERSGVGAAPILDKFGIKQVVDLPGVGKDYDGKRLVACFGKTHFYIMSPDHPFLVTPYIADSNAETYDALFRGEPEEWGSK